MLPHENLEKLIGTALVDREFCAALLRSPAEAAIGFGLSDEELGVLKNARASTLEDLAGYVHAWMNQAPQPRRGPNRRWSLEGYPLARVAV